MHKKIKQLRERHGLAQKDVAASLGVNPSAVTRWETGEKRPDLVNLVKLADLFDVSIDYLLGRTDNPVPVKH